MIKTMPAFTKLNVDDDIKNDILDQCNRVGAFNASQEREYEYVKTIVKVPLFDRMGFFMESYPDHGKNFEVVADVLMTDQGIDCQIDEVAFNRFNDKREQQIDREVLDRILFEFLFEPFGAEYFNYRMYSVMDNLNVYMAMLIMYRNDRYRSCYGSEGILYYSKPVYIETEVHVLKSNIIGPESFMNKIDKYPLIDRPHHAA